MQAERSAASRRELWRLACIVLLAVALRLALAAMPRVIRWDEPDYLWLGRGVWSGLGYTISGSPELHYTPLFPLLAGAIYRLTGNPELGSSFWYVLLGSLVCVPVYRIARRLYGSKVAVIAAVLTAVFPGLSSAVLYWGTMTEPLFILLVYSALWAGLNAFDTDEPWRYGVVGALLSLAYLARPEGIMWFGAFLGLALLRWAASGRLIRWRVLAHLAVYVAAFLLVATPYATFMYRQTGKMMATGKLSITYEIGEAMLERDPVLYDEVTTSLDSSGEILWWSNRRFDRGILDYFVEDPGKFVTRIWRNTQRMWSYVFAWNIFPQFLLAPLMLGWFRQPWTRRRMTYESILWCGVLPVGSFLPFHVEVRFFSPAFPALMIWLAAGLWAVGAWLVETVSHWRFGDDTEPDAARRELLVSWQNVVVISLFVLIMAYLGFTHVRTITRGMNDLSYSHKVVGLWLQEHAPQDAAIMSRDLAISLYAERGFVASPRADYAAYLDYARRKGASYLVVDEHELLVLRPYLSFLLDDQNPPPELEPVFSTADQKGRTIVYHIKG